MSNARRFRLSSAALCGNRSVMDLSGARPTRGTMIARNFHAAFGRVRAAATTRLPLRTTLILTAALCPLAPLAAAPLFYFCGWQIGGWIWTVLFAALVAVAHWRTKPSQLARSHQVLRRAVLPLILFVSCLLASGVCWQAHICMDGHMKHPPYAVADYVRDAGWTLGLVTAAAILIRDRSVLSVGAAAVACFLICFRWGWGSMGGIFPFPV